MKLTILLISASIVIKEFSCSVIKGKVWGPGLIPDKIVMPARYFFIEMEGQSTLDTKEHLQVIIDGANKLKQPCRIWTEVLSTKDTFFIVRYKLYEVCSFLKISVTYKKQHLDQSPYIINSRVLPDNCACPEKGVESFLVTWNCGSVPKLLETQLKEFGQINWTEKRKEVIEAFDKPLSVSLCHYVVKNNNIFRKCYGKYADFKMFVDKILLSLVRKTKLPDVEFFANLGDWPLSTHQILPKKFPILSWCGSNDSYDIIWPTYELTESILENMGRVSVNTLSVQGNVNGPWESRIPKLFWRGRDANRQRLDLIKISRQYDDLFNVSLTNFFFYKNEENIYGPKTEHVSFYRFFDYKYQLAIDGTVAPYRTPFLLSGGSLIFKPESKYFEHFYPELLPNLHYIPVKADLSDLVDKIKWAQQNDDIVKIIAKNTQKFANTNISHDNIFCYHVHALNEFSKIITSPIEVLEGMEPVKQEKLQDCDCNNDQKDEL